MQEYPTLKETIRDLWHMLPLYGAAFVVLGIIGCLILVILR